jgi:Ca2+-transporting ATPase
VKKRIPYTYDHSEGADPFLISSSQVMSGMGIMLVLAVGQHSYYGNLLSKMQEEHSDSPLKLKISDLSDEISELGIPIAIITFSSLILHYLYHCFQSTSPINEFFSV